MKYIPLKNIVDFATPIYRNTRRIKPNEYCRAIDPIKDVVRMLKLEGRNFGDNREHTAICNEFIFEDEGRFTIYPDSCELLESILAAKFNITSLVDVVPPQSSFSVMIPRGYVLPTGEKLESYMINWNTQFSHFNKHNALRERLGVQLINNTSTENVCYITYTMRRSVNDIQDVGFYCDDLLKLINSQSHIEFNEYLESVGISGCVLSEHMYVRYKYAFKIALGLAVYMNVYDGFLTNGLPVSDRYTFNGKRKLKNAFVANSSVVEQLTSTCSHIRNAHYRQLRNQKYYQGEYANKPIGSRFVFVKQSLVGRGQQAMVANSDATNV
ncbi:hypothetical protein ACS3CU_001804 [Vibrio parahaemolyticus]